MIAGITNEAFPAIQHQFRWESIVTPCPTVLGNSGYTHYVQNRLEQIPLPGEAKSAIFGLQVPGLPSSWDQTSHRDSSDYCVSISQPQSHNPTVHSDEKSPEFPAAQAVDYRRHFHNTDIFSEGWPGQAPDTVCGWGSSEQHTKLLRKTFVELLDAFDIETLNDAGCGDLAWMSMIDLEGIDYIGYDLHERANWAELRQSGFRLDVLDLAADEMRLADLIVCRDVFIHLPNDMILSALGRFRRSAPLLLITSYTSDLSLSEGEFSNFKRMSEPSFHHNKLDLTLPPFSLGEPLLRIPEDSPNKYLGLWDLTRPSTGP